MSVRPRSNITKCRDAFGIPCYRGILIIILSTAIPTAIAAQTAIPAPNTVTPPTLQPEHGPELPAILLPPTETLSPPTGAEDFRFTPGQVSVEGAFPRVASAVASLARTIEGRTVTLADVYRMASAIEAAHARQGFVLARVSIPPQRLVDGGPVRIVVTDGFIESIDVSGVPRQLRNVVAARLTGLRDVPQLTLARIERQILLAGDVAGATLRSTLARGDKPGGVRLLIDGQWRPLRASLRADNAVDRSLADASVTVQVSLNGLLGLGETIYAYAATSDPLRPLASDTRVRVIGTGVLLGIGDGRLTLNPEATLARTQPLAPPGVPRTQGRLERYAIRTTYVLARTRFHQDLLDFSIEALDQRTTAIDFGSDIARDRYAVARLGASVARISALASWSLAGQVGQGLGHLVSDLTVPPTRQDALATFTKLSGQGRVLIPVGRHVSWSAVALAQTSFGRPLLRAEQFQLEGSEAVSVFVGGVTAVDEGLTLRSELSVPVAVRQMTFAPYVFAAGGFGHVARPTSVEAGHLLAGAIGVGARTTIANGRLGLGFEYGYGFANLPAIDGCERVNFTASVRF